MVRKRQFGIRLRSGHAIHEGIERHKMKLPVTDYDELFFVLSFGDWFQQQLKQLTCIGAAPSA